MGIFTASLIFTLLNSALCCRQRVHHGAAQEHHRQRRDEGEAELPSGRLPQQHHVQVVQKRRRRAISKWNLMRFNVTNAKTLRCFLALHRVICEIWKIACKAGFHGTQKNDALRPNAENLSPSRSKRKQSEFWGGCFVLGKPKKSRGVGYHCLKSKTVQRVLRQNQTVFPSNDHF